MEKYFFSPSFKSAKRQKLQISVHVHKLFFQSINKQTGNVNSNLYYCLLSHFSCDHVHSMPTENVGCAHCSKPAGVTGTRRSAPTEGWQRWTLYASHQLQPSGDKLKVTILSRHKCGELSGPRRENGPLHLHGQIHGPPLVLFNVGWSNK